MDASMDDKLYYVESPDGQVLGPMNMIHILEGIAAGMILESARICEVGRQEWITLSDVAYTREGDPAAGHPGPTTPALDPPGAGAGFVQDSVLEQPLAPGPSSLEGDSQHPFEAASVPETGFFEPTRQSGPQSPPLGQPPAAAPSPEIWDSAHDVPAAIPPDPAPSDGAGDFTLAMPVEEQPAPAPVPRRKETRPKRRRWAVPAAIVVVLPVAAGVWFMLGEDIPFLSDLTRDGWSVRIGKAPLVGGPSEPSLKHAWALLSSGAHEEALAQFRRAVVENPQDPDAHHGLGRAALAVNEPLLAMKHLERAANLDPGRRDLLIDLGHAQLLADEPGLAERTARHVLSESADEAKAHLLLGRSLAALDDPEGAARELARYLESEPGDADARRHLAHAFARGGQVDAAIGEMSEYLAVRQDDTESQSAMLQWMLKSGKFAEAGRRYGSLADANRTNAFHQYLAGLAHPDSEEGVAFLERAIALDPAHGDAHATLGGYLEKLGRREEAMAALKRASEIRPGSAEERALLADFQTRSEPDTRVAAKAPEKKPAPRTPSAEPKPAPDGVGPWAEKIRGALDGARYGAARSLVESARANLKGDREARRNLDLWAAIIDFEEGKLDQALTKLSNLDPEASYGASGFGRGVVRNWIARTHLARGDARAAVAVLDQIGTEGADEYAQARLWEGVILSSLGMAELADRTWNRIASDVGPRVGPEGRAAMKSAQYLTGALSEKDYRTAVEPMKGFENDMHFFLGHAARLGNAKDVARSHFSKSMRTSAGHEFPYHLARTEVEAR